MSLILSIDTATAVCSVALTQNGRRLDDIKVKEERSHANLLTLTIQDILKGNNVGFRELSAIAISQGPGSYTGLRIGVSTAKGLSYTLSIPLIGVSTLKAMALEIKESADSEEYFVPMIDARRMEVYTAVYDFELNEILPIQAKILDEESFNETLSSHKALFGGDGSGKFKGLKSADYNAKFLDDLSPSAWAVGLLAFEKFKENSFEDVAYFEPYYLKEYRATKAKPLL